MSEEAGAAHAGQGGDRRGARGELGAARLSEPQAEGFRALNDSLAFDRRLWREDIAASRAHATMLADCGIIQAHERDRLLAGLTQVGQELERGCFSFAAGDEDIHMAIERRLIELVGAVGGKLHTARSRNDQVVTDLALHLRGRCERAVELLEALMATLLERAREQLEVALPGYTHLQRAQPVYLSHHLLAYFWMFARDRRRFAFAREEAGRLPLGAGALAGVGFAIDRQAVAEQLGFDQPAPNSIDAVASRDFALDYLSAGATAATHLSRLGSELVLWSSEELSFCELPDAWSATSSIMPQKKNPDAAELLRAKAPRIVGHLSALHGVLHALPLAYNKDLQEDKEHLFDSADSLEAMLIAAAGMMAGVTFNRERLAAAAADPALAATELADLLARRGLPFREAHQVVGRLVREALGRGATLAECSAAELARAHPLLGEHAEEVLALLGDPRAWIESKISAGGSARARVLEQLDHAQAVLDGKREL
jgi:argininosuccinate lyase